MERIATCLMFVGEQAGRAEEAMNLYVALFEGSAIDEVERWGPDEGDSGIKRATFRLAGRELVAMDSGGPHDFTFTPATSLVVEFEDTERLDAAWGELADGGEVLMPLQEYPFSPRFGWVKDRFGVSWQLMRAAR